MGHLAMTIATKETEGIGQGDMIIPKNYYNSIICVCKYD